MAYRFQPPRENPLVVRTVNLLYPVLMALRERIVRITIEPSDWRRLEECRASRALLLPNHPSEAEPWVLAGIARRLGQPFNYVATNELFQGAKGWLINRIGAFPIRSACEPVAALTRCRNGCDAPGWPCFEAWSGNTASPCPCERKGIGRWTAIRSARMRQRLTSGSRCSTTASPCG